MVQLAWETIDQSEFYRPGAAATMLVLFSWHESQLEHQVPPWDVPIDAQVVKVFSMIWQGSAWTPMTGKISAASSRDSLLSLSARATGGRLGL